MSFDNVQIMYWLGLIVVISPVLLFCLLGLTSLVDRPLKETTTSRAVQASAVTGLLAAITLLAMMLPLANPKVPVSLGNWVDIGHPADSQEYHRAPSIIPTSVSLGGHHTDESHQHEHDGDEGKNENKHNHDFVQQGDNHHAHSAPHYHFSIKFVFDRLSVPFVILTFILCGTIGSFATRYMHREAGYNRFFVLYSMFLLGMIVTSLAGTIETLFAGWELVGLSSALLVAFFHERTSPVRNGLRVWSVYRFSDAALLTAALTMHHMTGEGDFEVLMGKDSCWPLGLAAITSSQALLVGLLLLLAAAGKSALVPFSGWLPRAMEGPTPSSAIFYGALSVHLGAFLLLRFSPVLARSPELCVVITILGLVTAVYAFLVGRVQTDIKSDLCFASLTQVGLIVAEIGIGWRYIPLIHILGHGCLRTMQFVRAPTILQDYRILENAIGDHLPRRPSLWVMLVPEAVIAWVYRFALNRGYLDAFLDDYIVGPILRLFRYCDNLETRWTNFLSGDTTGDLTQTDSKAETLEDLS